MATKLTSKVVRETDIPADHRNKNIMIEIDPTGWIRVWEKGSRSKSAAPIKWLYQQILLSNVEEKRKPRIKRGLL